MQTALKLLRGVLAACAAMALLGGCDVANESLVAAIAPVSANQVADSLRRQIAQGKFVEASAKGARYLEDKRDAAGVVAWETARASAQAGKLDAAIRYAALAIEGGTVAGVDLVAEPLLAPVRSDSRFAALAAGGLDAPALNQLSHPSGEAEAGASGSAMQGEGGALPAELPE